MNYLFSKFFKLPFTGTFKNCIITYPQSHRKCYISMWYEWDLLVFWKQTSFLMGAIGTLSMNTIGSVVAEIEGRRDEQLLKLM